MATEDKMSELPLVWCDNPRDMQLFCNNLERLDILIEARRKFAMTDGARKNVLHEYLVLGKYVLDGYGQVGFFEEAFDDNTYKRIERDLWPELPPVISLRELQILLREHLAPKISYRWSCGGVKVVPKDFYQCNICGELWSLDDSSCVIQQQRTLYHSLDEVYSHHPSTRVMDYSTLSASLENLYKCPAWILLKESTLPATIDNIDKIVIRKVVHRDCEKKQDTQFKRERIGKAVEAAGLKVFGMVRTENKYGSEEYRGPWFLVDTEIGIFTIGWGKHVINIDYSQIDPKYEAITESTCGSGFEHVDGYEHLTEAIKNFLVHRQKGK